MNFRKTLTLVTLLALFAGITSCKKEKEEVTYLSFQNTIDFDLPAYVAPGESFTLDPGKPVRSSEDENKSMGTGCVWSCNDLEIRDTVRRESDDPAISYGYTFTVPDSIGTFTLKCSIFADGYYSTAAERSFVTVRTVGPCKSLQGVDYTSEVGSFTDSRDNRTYRFVSRGGLDWMAENLAWTGSGSPFAKSEVMGEVFGRFYKWNEAMSACPEGWRIPTDAEFMNLNNLFALTPATEVHKQFPSGAGAHMADAYFNFFKLWEYWPDVNISNKSQLSILPAGYATITEDGPSFKDLCNYGTFWTADECDSERAFYRAFYVKYDYINCGAAYKDEMAMPVRCVRNSN